MRSPAIRALIFMSALAMGGCFADATKSFEADESPPVAASSADAPEVMAHVNGRPIYMGDLIEVLLRTQGLLHARMLVSHELVRQEMEKKGLAVTDEEVEAQGRRILKLMMPDTAEPQDRRQALQEMLRRRNVSPEQWLESIRLTARLRKLAQPLAKVTDKMIEANFAWRYDVHVQVREIQVASLEKAQEMVEAARAGEDFAELARRHSIAKTAGNGGLLDPIGRGSRDVPPGFIEAAMSLTDVGDVCDPVQVDTNFYILKLEKIIPPRDVKLEDVRADLEADILEELLRRHGALELRRLTREADIQYANPILKRLSAEGKKP